jgi:TolA-binding protein
MHKCLKLRLPQSATVSVAVVWHTVTRLWSGLMAVLRTSRSPSCVRASLVVHEGSAVSDDVQSEVLHARSRIIELEETVNQLRGGQSELEKAQARITELVGSNAELQEKLAAASQTVSDLTAERDRLLAEVTAKAPGGDASADNEEPSSKAKNKRSQSCTQPGTIWSASSVKRNVLH